MISQSQYTELLRIVTPELVIENAKLKAEAAFFKGLLQAQSFGLPTEWRLSGQQQKIMGALLNIDIAPMQHLIERVWEGYGEPKSAELVVNQQIFRMRIKLAAFGIQIRNDYGVGFYLYPYRKTVVVRSLSTVEE